MEDSQMALRRPPALSATTLAETSALTPQRLSPAFLRYLQERAERARAYRLEKRRKAARLRWQKKRDRDKAATAVTTPKA